jgi:hypothetical protein
MRLEHELRRALERKDPASGFDDRVLSRIASGETVRMPLPRRRWSRVSLPLAASLMLAAGGTYYVQRHGERQAREERAQTEQAAHDVMLALHIASEKVSAARAKIEEITGHDPTNNR